MHRPARHPHRVAAAVLAVGLAAGGARAYGNEPPSVPVLRNPSDGAATTTTTPVFSWQASSDPEGDPILYEIEVRDDANALVGAVGVNGTATSIGQELVSGEHYHWRARAIDQPGAASDFSPANDFLVDAPIDNPEVQVNGEGCQAGGPAGSDGSGAPRTIVLAGAVAFALALRRRRRRGH